MRTLRSETQVEAEVHLHLFVPLSATIPAQIPHQLHCDKLLIIINL